MRGSYFWSRTTRLYTQWLQSYQRKDRLSHYQKLTSLSAFGSILKGSFFLETNVAKCEGHTFGWVRQDYVHDGYACINEKIDSHITKIRRAFRLSVPFWNFFGGNRCRLMWGPYFWLGTIGLCTCASTKRWTLTLLKIDEPFGVRFHFWKIFGNRCRLMRGSYFWSDTIRLWYEPAEWNPLNPQSIWKLNSLWKFNIIVCLQMRLQRVFKPKPN